MTDNERYVRQCQQAADGGPGDPWEYGHPATMQAMIDSGQAWRMEGSCGRQAMHYLEAGVCFLPETAHRDAYGNVVPPRTVLKAGTKGTLENAVAYWQENG